MLAKLHAIEKGSMGGVTYSDLKRNLKEFEYLNRAAWHDEKHLLVSEYYNKVGNLLFYKNGYVFGQKGRKNNNKTKFERLIYSDIIDPNELKNYTAKDHFKAPIAAYQYYRNSLEVIHQRVIKYKEGEISLYDGCFDQEKEKNMITEFLDFLSGENLKYPSMQNTLMETIGNCFSDFGNTILSSVGESETDNNNQNKLNKEFLLTFLGCTESDEETKQMGRKDRINDLKNLISSDQEKITRLEMALICFSISGMYFLKANRHRKHAFQSTKVLYVFKDYYSSKNEKETLKIILDHIKNGLIINVLKAIHRTNDYGARTEIKYFKEIFDEEINDADINQSILNSLSNTPELKEPLILFSELVLLSNSDDHKYSLPNSFLLHSYSGISSQFTRVLELKYKCHVNEKYFKQIVGNVKYHKESFNVGEQNLNGVKMNEDLVTSEKDYFKDEERTVGEALFHLITDSIYCLAEVIRIFNVFGASYMTTQSRFAFTHFSLAKWSERYHELDEILSENSDQDEVTAFMNRLLETNASLTIIPDQHYEMALKHFYAVLQVHNEGDGYKNEIYKMYYLEDDFNDNLYHFAETNQDGSGGQTGQVRARIER